MSEDQVANADDDATGIDAELSPIDAVFMLVRVNVLSAIIAIGVLAWIVCSALNAWEIFSAYTGGRGAPPDWYRWTVMGQGVAYVLWLGPLAIMVLMWLRERLGR